LNTIMDYDRWAVFGLILTVDVVKN
jgi:hypothetical protein